MSKTSETVSVTLTCPRCGSHPQVDEEWPDDAEVTCSNPECAAKFGTLGEIRKQAVEAVRKKIEADFKRIYRK